MNIRIRKSHLQSINTPMLLSSNIEPSKIVLAKTTNENIPKNPKMANGNDNAEFFFYLNDLEVEEVDIGDEDWMSTVTEENETEEDRILEINIIEEDSKEQALAEEIPEVEEADDSMEEDPAGTVINWPVSYSPRYGEFLELNDLMDLFPGQNPEDIL